jgi:hypothetical protein
MMIDIIENKNALNKIAIDVSLQYESKGKELPEKAQNVLRTIKNANRNYELLIDLSNEYARELDKKDSLIFKQVTEIAKLKRDLKKLEVINERLTKGL